MAEMLYARNVYGQTLLELGRKNQDIVVLDADLSGSTRTAYFAKEFPERFFNFGVAEQNMVAVACGLASCGKTPFVSTFAMFATARAWDQIRNTLCYNNFSVKIVASHGGITVGEDGSSHQALEDVAIMRAIPNMTVIVPADAPETKEAVIAAYAYPGPIYMRLGRSKVPTVPKSEGGFKIGKARILRQGKGVALIACGIMVSKALEAASGLEKEGISCGVLNFHTIKPLDTQLLLEIAKDIGRIVVCEEHLITGGLTSAVTEFLSENRPAWIQSVSIRNRFGQSGAPEDLLKEYNLTTQDIVKAAKELMEKKRL